MMPPKFIKPKDFNGPSVPEWLLHRSEVSPGAKLLYGYLSRHTCKEEFPQYHIASSLNQRTIAQRLGASERAIRNWLNELESADLIRCDVVGWGKPNLYIFLAHPWQKKNKTNRQTLPS
jgi:hypothetical protein